MKGNKDMRIGMGYDVHKLVKDRKLILGGVNIPYEKGLLGHSDADVLIHAIMDALLGAAALGDIGKHFPDNDDSYKGISSMFLLEKVAGILEDNMYVVGNIKATTEEGLGFTGSGEGISAQAICMIQSVYEGAVTVADSEGTGRCQGCAGCSRA